MNLSVICARPRAPSTRRSASAAARDRATARPPGRGHKGAKSRSGFKLKRGFEGGQMPLHRRVPKRGLPQPVPRRVRRWSTSTRSRRRFDAGTEVDAGAAARARAGRPAPAASRCSARGDITKKLTVRAHKFSGKAAEKIAAAGGTAEVLAVAQGSVLPETSMLAESLKNIFAVPDLRKRVLFTLGLLAVYRVGGHIPTPGVNTEALRADGRPGQEHDVRPLRHVLGQEPVADDDLRARRHAVHQRVDHPAAADGGLAVPRAAVEGRRARAPQDHAVHALRHDPA